MSAVVLDCACAASVTTRPHNVSFCFVSDGECLVVAEMTSTSGRTSVMSMLGACWGIFRYIASTCAKCDNISIRSSCGTIGRSFPFRSRIFASESTPTINTSPSSRAALRYRICPTCNISHEPDDRTIFLPSLRFALTKASSPRLFKILLCDIPKVV